MNVCLGLDFVLAGLLRVIRLARGLPVHFCIFVSLNDCSAKKLFSDLALLKWIMCLFSDFLCSIQINLHWSLCNTLSVLGGRYAFILIVRYY